MQIGAQNATDSGEVSIDAGVFTDPDGSPVTITATGLPEGLSIDPETGQITGTLTPGASKEGPYEIIVTATDPQGATVTSSFTLTVDNLPVVQAGKVPDQAYPAGGEVDPIDANVFVDMDGDELTFSAQGLPPGLVIDPQTGEITGELDRNLRSGAQFEVTIYVDDGNGATESVTFTFDIITSPSSGDGDISSPVGQEFGGGDVKTPYRTELLIDPVFNSASGGDQPNIVIKSVDELDEGVQPQIDAEHPVSKAVFGMSDDINEPGVSSDLPISTMIKREFAKTIFAKAEIPMQSETAAELKITKSWTNDPFEGISVSRLSSGETNYFKIYALDGANVRVVDIAGNQGNLVAADMISSHVDASEEIILSAEVTTANGVKMYEMRLNLETGNLEQILVEARGLGLREQAFVLSSLL